MLHTYKQTHPHTTRRKSRTVTTRQTRCCASETALRQNTEAEVGTVSALGLATNEDRRGET